MQIWCFWGFFFPPAYRIPSAADRDHSAHFAPDHRRSAFPALPGIYPSLPLLLCRPNCVLWGGQALQPGVHDREVKNSLGVAVKGLVEHPTPRWAGGN